MRRVRYDARARTLEIELDDQAVRVTGLGDASFQRQCESDSDEYALWVTADEAGVLVKMIEYVISKVKITDASRAALESVLPRAREVSKPSSEQTSEPPPATEKPGAEAGAAVG